MEQTFTICSLMGLSQSQISSVYQRCVHLKPEVEAAASLQPEDEDFLLLPCCYCHDDCLSSKGSHDGDSVLDVVVGTI